MKREQPQIPQAEEPDPASERRKRHQAAIEALNDTSFYERKTYGQLSLFEVSILCTTRFFSLPDAHRLTRSEFRSLCADLWQLQLLTSSVSLFTGKLPVMLRTNSQDQATGQVSSQRADTLMSLAAQLDSLDFKRTNLCIMEKRRASISLYSFVKPRYIYHPKKCHVHSTFAGAPKFACRQYLCVQGRDASIDRHILELAERYFQGQYVYWTVE